MKRREFMLTLGVGTVILHKKGYKARTIEKIIGGNYVRVFKEIVC